MIGIADPALKSPGYETTPPGRRLTTLVGFIPE
jgi:hypothetical protein